MQRAFRSEVKMGVEAREQMVTKKGLEDAPVTALPFGRSSRGPTPRWRHVCLVAPSHPVPELFRFLVFSGPFSTLKVKLLAGDLRAAQIGVVRGLK